MGWPVQLLQRYTTSREFTRWKVWLQEEPNELTADRYYLAAIATEVARGQAKNPRKLKILDFILKFKFRGKGMPVSKSDVESVETEHSQLAEVGLDKEGNELPYHVKQKVAESRSIWLRMFGIKR